MGRCRAAVIEVSPVCDFAQGKRPVCRFVAALIVPDELIEIFSKGSHPYRLRLGGFRLPDEEGVFHLVVNARFILTIKGADRLIPHAPCFGCGPLFWRHCRRGCSHMQLGLDILRCSRDGFKCPTY